MDQATGVLLVGLFFAILTGLIVLNAKFNREFKIEGSWIAVAVLPAVVWLFATGQLSELAGFGLEVRLNAAAKEPVSGSLQALPIEPVALESRSKTGFAALERMVDDQVPGLKFELGRTGYYNENAIGTYLHTLTRFDWFRYVLFLNPDGSFAAMAPGAPVLDFLERGGDLVGMIESGKLDGLPGLITDRVRAGASKREALDVFRATDDPVLPVVDDKGRFQGVVARGRIVGDILAELVTEG